MPLHNRILVRLFLVFFFDRISYYVLRESLFKYLYEDLGYSLQAAIEYTKIFDFNIIALLFAGFAIKFGVDCKALLACGLVIFLTGFGVLWGVSLISGPPALAIGIWAVGTAFIKMGLFIQMGNEAERPSLVLRNYTIAYILATFAAMLSGFIVIDSTEFNFDCGVVVSFLLSLLAFIIYRATDSSYYFIIDRNKALLISVALLCISSAFAGYLTNTLYDIIVASSFVALLILLWKEKKFTGLKIGAMLLYLYCVSYLFIETFEAFVRTTTDPTSKIAHYIGDRYIDGNISYMVASAILIISGIMALMLRQGRFEIIDNFKAFERVMWGIATAAAGYFFFSYINYSTTKQIPIGYFFAVLTCSAIAELIVRSTTLAIIYKSSGKNIIGLTYASSIGIYFMLNDLIYEHFDISQIEITKINYASIASIICFIIIALFMIVKPVSKLLSRAVYESRSTN